MLAAVETVTKADPVWKSRGYDSDASTKTTAGESVHRAPLNSKRPGRNEQRGDGYPLGHGAPLAFDVTRAPYRLHPGLREMRA
jgi:hypothetical protein